MEHVDTFEDFIFEASDKAKGDCYQVNAELILQKALFDDHQPNKDWFLVHGVVTGSEGGKLEGIKFGHAWCVQNDIIVWDVSNGNNIVMQKSAYYKLGNAEELVKYTPEETWENLTKYKNWGPWDKESNSLVYKNKN